MKGLYSIANNTIHDKLFMNFKETQLAVQYAFFYSILTCIDC